MNTKQKRSYYKTEIRLAKAVVEYQAQNLKLIKRLEFKQNGEKQKAKSLPQSETKQKIKH